MQVLLLTLLCGLSYTLYVIFAGLAGGKISEWLAAVLYNGIGTVIPLIIYLAATTKARTTPKGAFYASLAGIAIMLVSVLLARIFNKGGNLGFVVPTVYGMTILFSSLFGWLALKQKMTGLQVVGLLFVLVGVSCIIAAKLRVTA